MRVLLWRVMLPKLCPRPVVLLAESVSHSHSWSAIRMWPAISTSAVPASSSVPEEANASVYYVEVRASEEEVVRRGYLVDTEMPVASVPVEWAIEVSGIQEGSACRQSRRM